MAISGPADHVTSADLEPGLMPRPRPPKAPVHGGGGGPDVDAAAGVDPLQVAPRAKAGEVFVFVAAALGLKSEVMRGHVLPATQGRGAAVPVPEEDLLPLGVVGVHPVDVGPPQGQAEELHEAGGVRARGGAARDCVGPGPGPGSGDGSGSVRRPDLGPVRALQGAPLAQEPVRDVKTKHRVEGPTFLPSGSPRAMGTVPGNCPCPGLPYGSRGVVSLAAGVLTQIINQMSHQMKR